ncbi:MAG: cysteine--tRNA ligase [Planctomycetaceae bacterium]|nr:cysteine--tRNA ligase [Planctomycetaceae bacterium]
MPLRVYNTLTRQKEDFQTVTPGCVTMYLCGPTVYKPSHIGHMVGPVIFDTVKRYLVYSGYKVTFVVNITDVDDKIINEATKRQSTMAAVAREVEQDYFDNLKAMGVDSIDHFPRATEHIQGMLDIIGALVEKGYAYPLNGDVYFDCTKDEDYGKLSRRSIEEMLAGTRVEANDRKRSAADFALWKGSKPGEPSWESPWGPGRPGWHIECSAMAKKLLGESIDIHGGGLDLMFPHHENELAQSESCSGKPFARYWMHNGLMQSSGQPGKVGGGHDRHGDLMAEKQQQEAAKISKSTGAGSFKELLKSHAAETVRFFLLATHYRSPIDFSDERLQETAKSLDGFHRLFETYERVSGSSFFTLVPPATRSEAPASSSPRFPEFAQELAAHRQRFLDAMDDDFNTGGAVGVLFELRKTLNSFIADQKLESGSPPSEALAELKVGMMVLRELSALLGVFRESTAKPAADDGLAGELMELIIQIRADARKSKNFAVADLIRTRLTELKITLEDRPEKTLWRRGS